MEIILKEQDGGSEVSFTDENVINPSNICMTIDGEVFVLNLKELEAVVIAFNKVNEL